MKKPINNNVNFVGNIQSVIVMEEIMDQIATFLGDKTSEEIKEMNFYRSGQVKWAFITTPEYKNIYDCVK